MIYDSTTENVRKLLFDLWIHVLATKDSFNNDGYEEFLYNCHWHPAMGLNMDFALVREILTIKNNATDIEAAIPKVDSIIFKYYTKEQIEKLLLKWSQCVTDFRYKILVESIEAYDRQEYALTLCTLCCLWGNLINQIAMAGETKIKDVRKSYQQISDEASWYYKFFDNQIYYDCRSYDSIKDDVPGRNALAHGYFNAYPSRKATLNAIIFTDYLFDLWKKSKQ